MKTILIIAVLVISLSAIAQIGSKQSSDHTEQAPYKVLKKFKNFEIRLYEAALYSRVEMQSEPFRTASSKGFRTLASYIFGNNQRGEKIAMTSPVAMQVTDSNMVMKFRFPEGMQLNDLPAPNNQLVQFEEQPSETLAAIRFGGWATERRIEKYSKKLQRLLEKEGVSHDGKFTLLAYNPPFRLLNRRNEIVVRVTGNF
jgi:hypothetical protein